MEKLIILAAAGSVPVTDRVATGIDRDRVLPRAKNIDLSPGACIIQFFRYRSVLDMGGDFEPIVDRNTQRDIQSWRLGKAES